MEKRQFTRVTFQTKATIVSESNTTNGDVVNLSLQGILVKVDAAQPFEPGIEVEILISLSENNLELTIPLRGEVVRSDAQSVAIKFNLDGISLDSITHLRNLVGYGLGDFDQVIEEHANYLDRTQK